MQRTHLIIIVLFVFFIGCNQVTKKQKNGKKNVFLQKIDRPFVAGNFDKKGINDTIFFHYYSNSSKTEINEIPSSLNNDRDDIVSWFTQFQVDSYLTYKKDTLFIGFAYGFSCFFNIGDTNSDGKDEIAFVVDWLDYSNINSCQIYSMCNNQWELLKEFTIHESAFELPISDTVSSFSCIPGYLEKRNDIWMYKEYDVKKENDNSLKVLHLNKCNNLTSGLVIEKLVEAYLKKEPINIEKCCLNHQKGF